MKRSSSKLITRARSVRNMGKVPFKFKFDLVIETVDRLAASGDVVVVWERNNKSDATKPAKIDKNSRKANFGHERISSEITLFKTQPSERKFQDKVFKVAVRSGNIEGKTMGKIHLNFADYAEVPSGSKRISAELNNGATLIASIQCQFLSMGKASVGKSAKSESTAENEEGEDDLDSDSLDESSNGDDSAPSSYIKNKFAQKLTRAVSKKTISRHDKRGTWDDSGTGVANGNANSDVTEKLRKENNRLRKQVEELERSGSMAHPMDNNKLSEENRALKNEIKDLKMMLAREPVYADVVKDLKEAKMALALLHLEKEEYHLELMKYQRGEIVSPVSVKR